ncbi:MAG TPA: carbon-nitrogen hydrolase [Ignavibacteriaceae bacterium]|nr:carbon-nitrogen hydrolase [Ignavibacteriaceae bacterium]
MTNKKFNVGLIQISIDKDLEKNTKKAEEYITKAAKQGANVICLPELYRSLYFCQKEDIDLFDLAETVPGPSTKAFAKLAAKLNVVIVVPIFEKRAIGVYHNSVIVIDNKGNISGMYRKMHIPDDPAFYEKFYFTPGDLGFKSFNTEFGNIGTLICWDQWYPEGARLTALKGAEVLFYPTAIGWHPYEKAEHGKAQFESWVTVQRGHAIANGVYVAAANRVGHEKFIEGTAGLEFWGASFIADPQGIVIAQASHDKEEILIAEIDPSRIEYIRRNWPFLRDRRIDAYDGIEKRFLDESNNSSTEKTL